MAIISYFKDNKRYFKVFVKIRDKTGKQTTKATLFAESGNRITSGYDENGRVTSMANATRTGNDPFDSISSFAYSYDATGNRTNLSSLRSIPNHNPNIDFTYDEIGQLIQAGNPLLALSDEAFTYDLGGNRLLETGQSTASTIDTGNRLSEDLNFTFDYDLKGNIIEKINKATGQTRRNTFNVENELTKIELFASPTALVPLTTIEHVYDGLGRRIAKSVDGQLAVFFYDREDVIANLDIPNDIFTSYEHAAGIDEPLFMIRGTERFYFAIDGLGSITELVDLNGDVVQSNLYSSFGELSVYDGSGAQIPASQAISTQFSYTGREFDSESGDYYYRARYYDPGTGRFISEDPIGFAGGDSNLHRYVGNEPVGFVDPSGLLRERPQADPLGQIGPIGGIVAVTVAGGIGGSIGSVISGQNPASGFASGAVGGFVTAGIIVSSPVTAPVTVFTHGLAIVLGGAAAAFTAAETFDAPGGMCK